MHFEVPEAAKLRKDVRDALEKMRTGGVDPETVKLLLPHITNPVVVEQDAKAMRAAQAWTAGVGDDGKPNADCLECGACCQQGWRVDVRATDYPRMSEATKARLVVEPPKGAPEHVVGVLRIIDEPKQCAALTTHVVDGRARGCDIYEERPETCRTFPVGHERCVILRVERGLPVEEVDIYLGTDIGM